MKHWMFELPMVGAGPGPRSPPRSSWQMIDPSPAAPVPLDPVLPDPIGNAAPGTAAGMNGMVGRQRTTE